MEDSLVAILTDMQKQLNELTQLFVCHRPEREAYSVADFAHAVKKAPYTVREWCRHGRIRATKRDVGRGEHEEWSISRDEMTRYSNYGLLPLRKN